MDFAKDDLGRQKFADLLIGYATRLASASVSPAGRVIAVDAPWGAGKSWIAKRLPSHFRSHASVGNCVYVDAFQFDYHQDPFAVVTSAILDELQEHAVQATSLKNAAIQVLKVSLPAIGKGLIKAGGKADGFDTDEVADALTDATSDAGEKAIEQMLKSFSQTKESTEAFKKKLSELAKANPKEAPLVVIIDELDRCRPSYALEMLERVKHLFDVPNVVFIFFVHSPALHSAIRKTYGQDINPSEYLKKFFSITIGVPITERPEYKRSEHSTFTAKFIESLLGATNSPLEQDFRKSLSAFAPAFNASFRDIESAILLWQILPKTNIFDADMAGHGLLLKIKDPLQLQKLRFGDPSACGVEAERLGSFRLHRDHLISYMHDVFKYGSSPESYEAFVQTYQKSSSHQLLEPVRANGGLQDFQRLATALSLEYVRL